MFDQSQALPYLIQGNNIVVVMDNQSYTISKSHITYNQVLAAIKAEDWDTVKEVLSPTKALVQFSGGAVEIKDGVVYWLNQEMHNALTVRMIYMFQQGFNINPMVEFMENLMCNPSKRAVDELYGFLEKNSLPITPDGYFLAYKRVRDNYFDVHSGTMDNSVGKFVSMERNQVCDDKDLTCSSGLHFCSKEYLGHFGGGRIVIVKINPCDVVSIPRDYNGAKGRACAYTVVGEIDTSQEGIDNAFPTSVDSRWATEDHYEEEYDEEDEGHCEVSDLPETPIKVPTRDSKGRFVRKV